MNKLKLDLNELRVETFVTDSNNSVDGTVRAFDSTAPVDGCPDNGTGPACVDNTGRHTCAWSCYTCPATQCDLATEQVGCTLNGEFTCQQGCYGTQGPQQTCWQTCFANC